MSCPRWDCINPTFLTQPPSFTDSLHDGIYKADITPRCEESSVPLDHPRSAPLEWQLIKVIMHESHQKTPQYLYLQTTPTTQKELADKLTKMGFTSALLQQRLHWAEGVYVCHPAECASNRPLLGQPGWPEYPAGGSIDFKTFSSNSQLLMSDRIIPRRATSLQKHLEQQQASGASVKFLPHTLRTAHHQHQQQTISGIFCGRVTRATTKPLVSFSIVGMGTPMPLPEIEQRGLPEALQLHREQEKHPEQAQMLAEKFTAKIPPIYTAPLGDPAKPSNPQMIHLSGQTYNYHPVILIAETYPILHSLYGAVQCPQGLADRIEQDATSTLQHLLALPEVADRWISLALENSIQHFSETERQQWPTYSEAQKAQRTHQWVKQLCQDMKTDGPLMKVWQHLTAEFSWQTDFTGHSYGGTAMNNLAAVLMRLGLVNENTEVVTFGACAGMQALKQDMEALTALAKIANFISNRDPVAAFNFHLTTPHLTCLLPANSVFIVAPSEQALAFKHAEMHHMTLGYRDAIAHLPESLAEPASTMNDVHSRYVLGDSKPPLAYLRTPHPMHTMQSPQLNYVGHQYPCMREANLYWPTITGWATSKL